MFTRNFYFRDFVLAGTKHPMGDLVDCGPIVLNLGAGEQELPMSHRKLDLPEWDGERDDIPERDRSVDTIFAIHFLEHLSAQGVIHTLRECQRVMRSGGQLNIVVPHAASKLAYEDIDHRTRFCEDTWRNLFRRTYYLKHHAVQWEFKIGVNMLFGHKLDNLCLFTQLIRQ